MFLQESGNLKINNRIISKILVAVAVAEFGSMSEVRQLILFLLLVEAAKRETHKHLHQRAVQNNKNVATTIVYPSTASIIARVAFDTYDMVGYDSGHVDQQQHQDSVEE